MMDFLTLAAIASMAIYLLKRHEQQGRMRLLAAHLGRFQIEKCMRSLLDGYLRALGESDMQRRAQIWQLLANTERGLIEQFAQFAQDFSRAPGEQMRVSTLPLALPYIDRVFTRASFDMREMVKLHARALAAVQVYAANDDDERSARAFTLCAEILLMQHSCHWFCKSLTIASVRLLARQKTSYEQVLASVAAPTRESYLRLIGKR